MGGVLVGELLRLLCPVLLLIRRRLAQLLCVVVFHSVLWQLLLLGRVRGRGRGLLPLLELLELLLDRL